MNSMLRILFFRIIARFIGLNSRYFFFKLIGKPKSRRELSNEYVDSYNDFGDALKQDVMNALIGTIVFIGLSVLVVMIVF